MKITWEEAFKWADIANRGKIDEEPQWSFDCGFKLDFDGDIMSVSSRFYPPHKNSGNWWEGTVKVLFMGEEIIRKDFKTSNIDTLRSDVETFTKHYLSIIKSRLTT